MSVHDAPLQSRPQFTHLPPHFNSSGGAAAFLLGGSMDSSGSDRSRPKLPSTDPFWQNYLPQNSQLQQRYPATGERTVESAFLFSREASSEIGIESGE